MRSLRHVPLLLVVALVATCLGLTFQAPASAEPTCTVLDDAALQAGAPHLTGPAPASQDFACYVLPTTTGTTLRVGSLVRDYSVRVHDAAGAMVCHGSGADGCVLSGEGPHQLRVFNQYGVTTPYEVQVLELDSDTGCEILDVRQFGPSGNEAVAELRRYESACRTVDLAAGGGYLYRTDSQYDSWALHDPAGKRVCGGTGTATATCGNAEGGAHTLVLTRTEEGFAPIEQVRASLVDLVDDSGCGATLPTTWTTSPRLLPVEGEDQVDCVPFEGTPGDRVAPATDSSAGNGLVVDSTGAEACDWETAGDIGCTLEGVGPYKFVISWPESMSYVPSATVRAFGETDGCPVISPKAFGAVPTDDFPGLGCRRFHAAAGQKLLINAIDEQGGHAPGHTVYGPDYARPCQPLDDGRCTVKESGRHTVITSLFGEDTRTALYDLTSSNGCVGAQATLAKRAGSLALGQVKCLALASAGAELGVVRSDLNREEAPVTVIDSAGASMCSTLWDTYVMTHCELDGKAPYRAIVGSGEVHPYTFGFLRPESSTGCQTLPYGVETPLKVSFGDGQFARCFRADKRRTDEFLHLKRLSGNGLAQMAAFADYNCSTQSHEAQMGVPCRPGTGRSTYSIVVVSNGVAASFRAVRTAYTDTVINVRRPQALGTPRVDQQLRVDPGEWWYTDATYTYQWRADGRPIKGKTGSRLTVTSGLLGKSISVTVKASRQWVEPGQATSTTRRVILGSAPKAVARPVLRGTHRVGTKLTTTLGSWSKKPGRYSFKWYVNGKRIAATSRTVTLKSTWVGKRVKVVVVAHRAGCASGSAASVAITVRR